MPSSSLLESYVVRSGGAREADISAAIAEASIEVTGAAPAADSGLELLSKLACEGGGWEAEAFGSANIRALRSIRSISSAFCNTTSLPAAADNNAFSRSISSMALSGLRDTEVLSVRARDTEGSIIRLSTTGGAPFAAAVIIRRSRNRCRCISRFCTSNSASVIARCTE